MFVSWGALSNLKKQPKGLLCIHGTNRRGMMSLMRERTLSPCTNRVAHTFKKVHGHVSSAGVYHHPDKSTTQATKIKRQWTYLGHLTGTLPEDR
jgi:hypothetical protein